MLRHRLLTVAIAAAALAACTPSITPVGNPAFTDYVLLDPAVPQIPLPNDLVRQPSAVASATGAQQELLSTLAPGFPSDQALQVTIDVQRYTYSGNQTATAAPPVPVDLATLTPDSLIVADITDPTKPPAFLTIGKDIEARYGVSASGDRGSIFLRRTADPVSGSRRWQAGHQYAVLLRSGASGVKLKGGGQLTAQATMYLLTRGADLTKPENQYLLPGDGRQGRAQTGAQLEALRKQYLPLFNLADTVWGTNASKDLGSVQTFLIAPNPTASTAVAIDSVLPSDLLLDPIAGKVVASPDAFCDWSPTAKDPSTKLDDTGSCPRAQAFATLDGFSTTAMHLIGTTAPVQQSSVTYDSVRLYEVGATGLTRVPDVTQAATGAKPVYVTQPPQVACPAGLPPDCAPVIALQPGVPVPPNAPSIALPPLKEATQYAVVITTRVKDVTTKKLARSSFTNLLFFKNPLADLSTGKSLVSSLSDAQAVGIEKARTALMPALLQQLQSEGVSQDEVAIAYTVKTQSFTGTALKLAAAPYQQSTSIVPKAPRATYATLTEAASAYKIPVPPASSSGIEEVLDVPIPTINATSNTTGALEPDTTKWQPNLVTALVTVPKPALVPTACPGGTGAKCAPLVVFHHGLNGNRGQALLIAEALAAKGFAMAAIDAPFHGDRGLCATGVPGGCPSGATCVKIPGSEGQGDPTPVPGPPGQCTMPDGTVVAPTLATNQPQPYFVSGNLFRTRDALRQDIIDQSSLVLALARPPAPTLPAVDSPIAAMLAQKGIVIDPSRVYWVGQSLGGIEGTVNMSVNPRFSNGVLNVDGGTIVDIFTQSPAFTGRTDPTTPPLPTSPIGALLASQGITFGSGGYLQFLHVAKWVLDGAEPLNFAQHLVASPLPDPLSTSGATQSKKNILGQVAFNDAVIPNPQSFELFTNIFGPLPTGTTPSNVSTYSGTGVDHGFLLDYGNPAATVKAQSDAAAFLADPTALPPATQPF